MSSNPPTPGAVFAYLHAEGFYMTTDPSHPATSVFIDRGQTGRPVVRIVGRNRSAATIMLASVAAHLAKRYTIDGPSDRAGDRIVVLGAAHTTPDLNQAFVDRAVHTARILGCSPETAANEVMRALMTDRATLVLRVRAAFDAATDAAAQAQT